MITRSEAERELNRLLKRALRSVPFVRLDKVEEVTEKFKLACTLLEDHLEGDYDLNAEEDDGADEAVSNIPRSVPTDSTKAGGASDSSEDDEDDQEEKERAEKEQKELEEKEREARNVKPKAGDAVRKDFSSPDIRSRGLKGAGTASGEEPLRKVGQSSRAAGLSSRAKPDVEKETPAPRIGLKASTGGGGGSRPKDVENLRKQLIKSKKPPTQDVAVSKDRFTKDEGTPRLGGRSLLKAAADGARSKSTSDLFRGEEGNTAVLARDAVGDAPDVLPSNFPPKKLSSRAATGLAALPTGLDNSSKPTETTDIYREDSDNNEDIPQAKSVKSLPADIIGSRGHNPAVDRITEQALETPHSPLQLNAHRTLLKIAQKSSGDSEIIPIQQKVETPKPAFLRRLDSPKTNHGILIAHKTRLNKMLRRARRAVPHMKLDQYETVRQAFIQAVELLEQSTTMALAKKEAVTIDPLAKALLT